MTFLLKAFRVFPLLLVLGLCSCGSYQDLGEGPFPGVKSVAFQQKLSTVAKAPWVSGNKIETLVNGDAYYPRMIRAIKGAQKSITFETFAYVKSYRTRDFTLALAERARAGVKVHMILDAIGSRRIVKEEISYLRDSGVELHLYHPRNPLRLIQMNNRTHRKIMVVDGLVAYTGGAGFADAWNGDARNSHEWRDTQYEIRGPLVAKWQDCFNNNWKEITGTPLSGPLYFPKLPRVGSTVAQVSLGAPYEQGDTLGSTCLLAIESAQKEIYIEQAYLIIHKTIRNALLRARARGVRIVILSPSEEIDVAYVRETSHTYWKPLLNAGVEMYEFQPSMMHAKVMVVDRYFSIVGSANLDPRSYFLNDEANLNVLSKEFAQEQVEIIQADLKRSKRMTWEMIKGPLYRAPYRLVLKGISPAL